MNQPPFILKTIGISRDQVMDALGSRLLPRPLWVGHGGRRPPISEAVARRIRELRATGMKMRAIAQEMNVSQGSVCRCCHKENREA